MTMTLQVAGLHGSFYNSSIYCTAFLEDLKNFVQKYRDRNLIINYGKNSGKAESTKH
jgi:hypothetical protein